MYCKCSYIYYATSEWISWVRVKKNIYAGKYQQFYVNGVTLILSYQISIENIYDQVDKFPLKLVCRMSVSQPIPAVTVRVANRPVSDWYA